MPTEALDPKRVQVHGVQFVGTNVEMTYVVRPPAGSNPPGAGDEGEADVAGSLDALFASKLGLYAITATGELEGRPRFSVIASPLERLFHKIGPMEPLTVIKHAARTLDLSEAQAGRVGEALAPSLATTTILPTWETGKLIAVLLRRPALLRAGEVRVAGARVAPPDFPNAMLPWLPEHVAATGGVDIELAQEIVDALQQK